MTFTNRELNDLLRALHLAGRWHESELDGLEESGIPEDLKRARLLRRQVTRFEALADNIVTRHQVEVKWRKGRRV